MGKHTVPLDFAVTLADFYDVSLDYIAGRTNYPLGAAKPMLKQDELELVKKYSDLTERNKGRVDQFVDTVSEQQVKQKEA